MKKVYKVYDHQAAKEPMFPSSVRERWDAAATLVQTSAKRGSALHLVGASCV